MPPRGKLCGKSSAAVPLVSGGKKRFRLRKLTPLDFCQNPELFGRHGTASSARGAGIMLCLFSHL
jgi:hypothetical protein